MFSQRACGLPVQSHGRIRSGELHLIVDSTGLKLRGAGEWLLEKHGTAKRRAWRKLHIGIDAVSGEIVAFGLPDKDVDDASRVEPLLAQLSATPASSIADAAYDRSVVHDAVMGGNPRAQVIVPPCNGAVPGLTATSSPTQRDEHVLAIEARGRANWQKATGYNRRSKVEAAMSRYKRDKAQKFIAPTLLTGAGENTEIMGQEIFGPVLPIFAYRDLAEPLAAINARPKPLALYVFAKDRARIERVLRETSAGGSCVNAAVVQFGHDNLPFGGIGNSGLGNSHGFYGFRTFSHERAVLEDKFSIVPMLFPPYTPRVKQMIQWTLRYFT